MKCLHPSEAARSKQRPASADCRISRPLPGPSRKVLKLVLTGEAAVTMTACTDNVDPESGSASSDVALIAQGREIFRFDTFGDENKWTDTLRRHEVISKSISPVAALAVGLKGDSETLPSPVVQEIQNKSIDLASPATPPPLAASSFSMRPAHAAPVIAERNSPTPIRACIRSVTRSLSLSQTARLAKRRAVRPNSTALPRCEGFGNILLIFTMAVRPR